MTDYAPGTPATLTAEWRTYAGGPLSPVTGVTISVVRVADAAVVLATTTVGVSYPATGLNAYVWAVPGDATEGQHVALWSAVDGQGDTVSTAEYIDVATPTDVYASLAMVKEMLTKDSEDARDDLIIKAIRTASRLIDKRTGRRFYPDTVATTRSFPVVGQSFYEIGEQAILVDDIASLDDLSVTGGAGALAGYMAGPDNALIYGRPLNRLTGTVGWLPSTGRLQVTARWGWPEVPDEIEQATALFAARLYRRKDSPQGVIGSADFGVIRVSRFDPDVESLIAPFVVPVIA